MKISTSSIATLAIALTAVGGAALGISRVASLDNQVNVPASSTVVDSTNSSTTETVAEVPSGKIASVITPSASPAPVAPTPTPTTTPTDPNQGTTPVAPLNPVFGSGGDDDESDDSYGNDDDGESDDDSYNPNSNYGSDDDSDYQDESDD
jgi:hypothetical protein